MSLPLWSTPERRQHLVKLFQEYGNLCLQGHPVCPNIDHYVTHDVKMEWVADQELQECVDRSGNKTGHQIPVWKAQNVPVYKPYLARMYNKVAEAAIHSWKAEDRERRAYEWKLEQQQIIDGTYGTYGSTFDPVARDVYFSNRPEYYLVGIGVNPFTYKRVALIRVPSTFVHLFVNVGGALQEVSKNARRKAMRYKNFTSALTGKIDESCKAAVADWWLSRR